MQHIRNSSDINKWRVKVYEIDPISELEGWSYYDFNFDVDAWRFREVAMKSSNVTAVQCPIPITV